MPIQKLLVANRGEIAVRIFRTCLALDIATVAVVAPDDTGSLHAHSATEVVEISSYLHPEEHIRAAKRAGADRVRHGVHRLICASHFGGSAGLGGTTGFS